jgi:putative ABC transport system ATP-binding protein
VAVGAAAWPGEIRVTGRPIIELTDVIRVYREADVETIALRGVDLEIRSGEFLAIMGRSGSGKSTLLQLLGGSDRPTAGRIVVDRVDLARAGEDERARLRGAHVGIVFQSQNLVPFLDLEENVGLASRLAGHPVAKGEARQLLARVGLEGRGAHRPAQLSGGEQQRAALALVLISRPSIVLADEITGELDSTSAALLLDLLEEIHRVDGVTLVLATHDPDVARRADRVVELRDGRIVDDRRRA